MQGSAEVYQQMSAWPHTHFWGEKMTIAKSVGHTDDDDDMHYYYYYCYSMAAVEHSLMCENCWCSCNSSLMDACVS